MTTTGVHFFPSTILPHPCKLFLLALFVFYLDQIRIQDVTNYLVIIPENRAHGFLEALLSVAESIDHHRTRNFAGHLRGQP